MRTTARYAVALLSAVALATCSDAPTGPGSGSRGLAARIALAPGFSAGAQQAASVLREAGVTIASIRVLVTRPGTEEVLFDRVVAVTPGHASITLEVDLEIRAAQELLDARIDFRDASGTVMYTARQTLTVKQGSNEPGDNPPFVAEFVGPGASATLVHLAPADTAISTATPLQMRAAALDAAGATIAGAILAFSSSDVALAPVTATGVLVPTGLRGSVQVGVRTPTGISATASIKLVPPPARLVIIGGDAQVGPVGTVLAQPFTVEIQAADGLPSPGETVTFLAVTPGGSVATATAVTDAQGRASTAVTLGTVAGTYQFRAVSGSLPAATITTKALAGAAAKIEVVSGNAQRGEVATLLPEPLRVRVADAFGNVVQGATVAWSVLEGSGLLSAPSTVTDAAGKAQVTLTLGTVTGTVKVGAALPGTGASTSFTATALAAPATMLQIVQQPPSEAVVGVVFPTAPRVQLANAYGPVAQSGRSVSVSVYTASANVGAMAVNTIVADEARTPSEPVMDQGRAAVLPRGDAALRALPGAEVSAAAVLSLAGATTVTTDAAGVATFPGLSLSGPVGPVTLRFSADTLTAATSTSTNLLAGAVASLVALPAPPAGPLTITAGELLPDSFWLETLDAAGNRVANAPVRFKLRNDATGLIAKDTIVFTAASGAIAAPRIPVPSTSGLFTVGAYLEHATTASFVLALDVKPSTVNATLAAVGDTLIRINVGPTAIGSRSVVVRDASGVPIPSVAVRFTLPGSGTNGVFTGEVYEIATTTGTDGVASFPLGVTWTPPSATGVYTMESRAGTDASPVGTIVRFAATRSQWTYQLAGSAVAPLPGTEVMVTAQLVDGSGVPLPADASRLVTWTKAVATGAATTFATTPTTESGAATARFVTDSAAAAVHTVAVGDNYGVTGSVTIVNAGVAAAAIAVTSGDAQSDTVNALLPLPLKVRLTSAGAPLGGRTITWKTVPIVEVDGYVDYNAYLDVPTAGGESGWAITATTTTDAEGYTAIPVRAGTFATATDSVGIVRAEYLDGETTVAAEFRVYVRGGAPSWIDVAQGIASAQRVGIDFTEPVVAALRDAWGNPSRTANVPVEAVLSPYGYATEGSGVPLASAAPTAATQVRTPWRRPVRVAPVLSAGVTASTAAMLSMDTLLVNGTLSRVVATDARGEATFTPMRIHGRAGQHSIGFASGTLGSEGSVTVGLGAGIPARWNVESLEQSLFPVPGDTIPLRAWVVDAWNNTVADSVGRTLTWRDENVNGGGTFSTATVATTTEALVDFVASSVAGTSHLIRVTDGKLAGALPQLNVTVATPDAIALISGDDQTTAIGGALSAPLTVRVLRADGSPVAGATVGWSTHDEDGAPYPMGSTLTDAEGVAAFTPTMPGDTDEFGWVIRARVEGAVSRSGAPIEAHFRAATVPAGVTHVWFGPKGDGVTETSQPWSVAEHWHSGSVPGAGSNVVIPGWRYGWSPIPYLDTDVTVNDVHAYGASGYYLDVRAQTLTVLGNLKATYLLGTGTIALAGAKTLATVDFYNGQVRVPESATVTMSGPIYSAGVVVNGTLAVGANYLDIYGDLTVAGPAARLVMNNAGGETWAANATFAGAQSSGFLERGYLGVRGNFEQRADVHGASFAPGADFRVYLYPDSGTVTFATPGPDATSSSYFSWVEQWSGVMTQKSPVHVTKRFDLGSRWYSAGLTASAATLNNGAALLLGGSNVIHDLTLYSGSTLDAALLGGTLLVTRCEDNGATLLGIELPCVPVTQPAATALDASRSVGTAEPVSRPQRRERVAPRPRAGG